MADKWIAPKDWRKRDLTSHETKLKVVSKQEKAKQDRERMAVLRGRPILHGWNFRCVKCQKEPEKFTHYGAVSRDYGYLHCIIQCHGENLQTAISWADAWEFKDKGQPQEIFESQNHEQIKETKIHNERTTERLR